MMRNKHLWIFFYEICSLEDESKCQIGLSAMRTKELEAMDAKSVVIKVNSCVREYRLKPELIGKRQALDYKLKEYPNTKIYCHPEPFVQQIDSTPLSLVIKKDISSEKALDLYQSRLSIKNDIADNIRYFYNTLVTLSKEEFSRLAKVGLYKQDQQKLKELGAELLTKLYLSPTLGQNLEHQLHARGWGF